MSKTALVGAILVVACWGALLTWQDYRAAQERAAWQAQTDSLLVAGKQADSVNAAQARIVDSLEHAAKQIIVVRPKVDARLDSLSQVASGLRSSLYSAVSALDSLPLAVAVIHQQDTVIATLDSALRLERVGSNALAFANTLLHQRITSDSGRIVTLTRQLQTVPKPASKGLFGLPFHVQPCLFGGVTTRVEARAGLGVCLTR